MKPIKDRQLEFLDWEMGVFFHFGIRTFYEGHRDWDMKEMPLSGFDPSALDCEQWIRTAKEAGAAYAVLVCKHHDGFANWPSKYTEYSVKNTPWKSGQGDVVREFVEACRKYDVKIGLYYSPAQFGSIKMEPKEYDDYFINQISELLTDYGKIDYLWFDGCGSENHKYDSPRIIKAIRGLQPEILIFNMWDPDTRWIGNEAGLAHVPNSNLVDSLSVSVMTEDSDGLDSTTFLPGECDCRIRYRNWFYSDMDAHTLKSLDELMGLYYYSVGRGANLLVNIAPDRRGLLPEADAARFVEFGKCVKERFAHPLASEMTQNGNRYTLKLAEEGLVNHVVLEECLEEGDKIQAFSVYIYPTHYGKPILVYRGETVGHKCICQFPTVCTPKIDVVIEKEKASHKMKRILAHYVG